jgi:apolipoprotein N-acyltransferase
MPTHHAALPHTLSSSLHLVLCLQTRQGLKRRDREISAATSLLGHPLAAATLGLTLGVFLTYVSHRAVTFVTPEDPMRGLAVVAGMMGARFVAVLVALVVYYVFARAGLVYFGLVLAVSFVAGLMLEAVRMSSVRSSHTSA